MVGINLKVQVRRRRLHAGAAHIADQFSRSHHFTLYQARSVSLQVHVAIAFAVLTSQEQGNAGFRKSC